MSKTELKDRTLYFDGDSVVSPELVITLFDMGATNVCVTKLTDDLIEYNKFVPPEKQVRIKTGCRPLTLDWNIPDEYRTFNVKDYVFSKAVEVCALDASLSDSDVEARVRRVQEELGLYERLRLIPVLRAMIFVINTLRDNNIVWGVGRGSSVSSYVLYLIGVHDVDSVKFDLDFKEFLREPDTE